MIIVLPLYSGSSFNFESLVVEPASTEVHEINFFEFQCQLASKIADRILSIVFGFRVPAGLQFSAISLDLTFR